jgi:hypothetical protein
VRAIAKPMPDDPPVMSAALGMRHLYSPEGSSDLVPNTTRGIRQGSSSPLTAATLRVAAGSLQGRTARWFFKRPREQSSRGLQGGAAESAPWRRFASPPALSRNTGTGRHSVDEQAAEAYISQFIHREDAWTQRPAV